MEADLRKPPAAAERGKRAERALPRTERARCPARFSGHDARFRHDGGEAARCRPSRDSPRPLGRTCQGESGRRREALAAGRLHRPGGRIPCHARTPSTASPTLPPSSSALCLLRLPHSATDWASTPTAADAGGRRAGRLVLLAAGRHARPCGAYPVPRTRAFDRTRRRASRRLPAV
jgi:hypothetical protein